MRINEDVDELFMDMKCQGACAVPGEYTPEWMITSRGTQVRWNPLAGKSFCASCQEQWSSYYSTGHTPPWMKK